MLRSILDEVGDLRAEVEGLPAATPEMPLFAAELVLLDRRARRIIREIARLQHDH